MVESIGAIKVPQGRRWVNAIEDLDVDCPPALSGLVEGDWSLNALFTPQSNGLGDSGPKSEK